MLSPEEARDKIKKMKPTERLESFLDQIDFNKIDKNSHRVIINCQGFEKGMSLLWCAVTKFKWPLVRKLIGCASNESINVYETDNVITLLSQIPDYLMPEIIAKAKQIDVNLNWKKIDLLTEVITEGHDDILHALLQKGAVSKEVLKAYITNGKINATTNLAIKNTIEIYIKACNFYETLSYNLLFDTLSINNWLFEIRLPNQQDTFKDQIINRLTKVNKNQLIAFYKRFPQFKPADFQIEEPVSVPPLLPPTTIAEASSQPQLQQNGVEHKKELSLAELLYQGKHEILIERLQKGEIAFEQFDPFVTDAPENAFINYNCKNVIEVCLKWRTKNFDLPNSNAFKNLLDLFGNNEWLFTVHDFSSKKTLLELTRNKLRIRPQLLKEFNEKFPNCDALLKQNNTAELQNPDKDHPTNGSVKKDDELKTSTEIPAALKDLAGEVSSGAVTPPQATLSHVAEAIVTGEIPVPHINGSVMSEQQEVNPVVNSHEITTGADQPAKSISKESDESIKDKKQISEATGDSETTVATVSVNNDVVLVVRDNTNAQESKKKEIPLAQQMKALLNNFDETEGVSVLGAVAQTCREAERKKAKAELFQQQAEEAARVELLRKQEEQAALARLQEEQAALARANAQGNPQIQTSNRSNATTLQLSSGEAVKEPAASEPIASNPPKKDLQQFYAEQKSALESEIYTQEIGVHENKKLRINKVKEIFSNLYVVYKEDNKSINENNRNVLLDIFCELYKNISEQNHKEKIDIHNYPTYDRFFRKHNTNSWQEMVKEIREMSLGYLLSIADEQFKSHPDKTVSFLNNYIKEPLFCEHRSNVAICRIGDTHAVKQIKFKSAEYTDAIGMVKRGP